MSPFLTRHTALFIGILFSLISLGIYATFIFPYFLNAPVPTIIFTILLMLFGENHSLPSNLISFMTMLLLLAGLSYLFFTRMLRPQSVKRYSLTGMTILFMTLLLCLLHPLFLYAMTIGDWLQDDRAIPLLKSNVYYPWSSFLFPLFGYWIDRISHRRSRSITIE